MPEPTSRRQLNRYAELKALGLSSHESARAVGLSPRQGDRLATRPDVRDRIERLRTEAQESDSIEDVRRAVASLLQSDNETGKSEGRTVASPACRRLQ